MVASIFQKISKFTYDHWFVSLILVSIILNIFATIIMACGIKSAQAYGFTNIFTGLFLIFDIINYYIIYDPRS
jgi:hypothetical protein